METRSSHPLNHSVSFDIKSQIRQEPLEYEDEMPMQQTYLSTHVDDESDFEQSEALINSNHFSNICDDPFVDQAESVHDSFAIKIENLSAPYDPTVDTFECFSCKESFGDLISLNEHLQKQHSSLEKKFECEKCKKTFTTQPGLNYHKLVHTGLKPFQCTYCNQRFRQRTSLKYHIRNHTGEKPFKCTYCNQSFNLKSNLKIHIRIHTGEKPYVCQKCNECFAQLSNLNYHVKTKKCF